MSTSITVDDGKTSVVPGSIDTYTIVVSNSGPAAVTGAAISDPLPASGVTAASWLFAGSTGGGSVTGPASGSGPLATTVNLPATPPSPSASRSRSTRRPPARSPTRSR